jgi:hypothetical protein
MDWDDYLRQQATMYRQLAERTEDTFIKQELLELSAVCEEVANNIEDRLAVGSGAISDVSDRAGLLRVFSKRVKLRLATPSPCRLRRRTPRP